MQDDASAGPSLRAPRLLTIAATAAALPAFSEPTLRDFIYHAEPRVGARGTEIPANGFAVCIVRIPGHGRVLIDFDRMLEWIESGRGKPSRKRRFV